MFSLGVEKDQIQECLHKDHRRTASEILHSLHSVGDGGSGLSRHHRPLLDGRLGFRKWRKVQTGVEVPAGLLRAGGWPGLGQCLLLLVVAETDDQAAHLQQVDAALSSQVSYNNIC